MRQKIIVDESKYIPKPQSSEPQKYSLAAHRILVNDWSFERFTKMALYDMQKLKSLYKMLDGSWTTEREKAHFYHWNGKESGNLCCDVRYEIFWSVNGVEIKDYQEAFDRLYEELFIKPVMPYLMMGLIEGD